jgi:hypothetical protein
MSWGVPHFLFAPISTNYGTGPGLNHMKLFQFLDQNIEIWATSHDSTCRTGVSTGRKVYLLVKGSMSWLQEYKGNW